MAVRKQRHYRVCVEQRLALDIGMRHRDVEQPEVELPRAQAPDLLQRGDMRDLELKARLTRGEGGQESLQSVERHGRRRADPHHRPRPRGTSGFGHGVLERSQHAPCLAGERKPGRGWDDRAAGALKELDAELVLEPADRLREGRLRDPQARGRSAEVKLLHDREVVPEMSKLDRGVHTSPNGSGSSDSRETLGPLCPKRTGL